MRRDTLTVAPLRAALLREITGHDRRRVHFGIALRCTAAVLIAVAFGVLSGRRTEAAILCGGALTVGAGIYQRLARSQLAPMLAATFGVGLATALGTLAGLSSAVLLPLVLLWGFLCGLLPALGPGAQWIGQQCTIALMVAASFPGASGHALLRALLVMAGGALQILAVEASLRFTDVTTELAGWRATLADLRAGLRHLRQELSPRSIYFRFALRVALTLALAVATSRLLRLQNGYWVGMTALLLLRLDFHDTWHRSASRVAGTVAGAAVALLVTRFVVPGPVALATLITVLAYLAFAYQQYSYALFSTFLTAYIVFLLSYGGFGEQVVARNRVAGTLLGGAFALAAHLQFSLRARRMAEAGATAQMR